MTCRGLVVVAILILAGSGVALAQPAEPLYRSLLVANMGLSSADTILTLQTLRVAPGAFREGNPVLQPLVDHPAAFGTAKISVDAGMLLVVDRVRSKRPRAALGVLIAWTAAKAVVVGWNMHQAQHARRRLP